MNLTVAYVTSRKEPRIEWFFDSLKNQLEGNVRVIVVDHFYETVLAPLDTKWGEIGQVTRRIFVYDDERITVSTVAPKPTVWQGPHRLTNCDWWAKSNALNTAICLCETEWIAFVDDRSVLAPGWLNSVHEAMQGGYAVCGSYEKRAHLEVKDGEVIGGDLLGEDTRTPGLYPFDSWYGGSGALPLGWCLAVNGFSEDLCDGLGSEDSMFGVTLRNMGYPVKYDSRMKIIEDRTPGQLDGALKRADKGISPNDKSHAIVERFQGATTSMNSFDIRELRTKILAGVPFDPPTASGQDWFDGEFLENMK